MKKHGKEAIPYVEARRIWYAFARHPEIRKTIIDGAALKTQMQLSEAKENGLLECSKYRASWVENWAGLGPYKVSDLEDGSK